MEFLNTPAFQPNTATIFFGFLLSNSFAFIATVEHAYIDQLSDSILILILSTSFLLTVGSFVYYLFSKSSSFLLQLSEYILYPINMYVFMLGMLDSDENGNVVVEVKLRKITFLILIILNTILIFIKIIFVNQIFYDFKSCSTLSLRILIRIYRVIRLILQTLLLIFLDPEICRILFYFLNSLELILAFSTITYSSVYNEEAMMVSSVNIAGSIFIYELSKTFSTPLVGLTEVLTVALYFLKYNEKQKKYCLFLKYKKSLDKELKKACQFAVNNEEENVEKKMIYIELMNEVVIKKGKNWPVELQLLLRESYMRIITILLEIKNQVTCMQTHEDLSTVQLSSKTKNLYESHNQKCFKNDFMLELFADEEFFYEIVKDLLPISSLVQADNTEACLYYLFITTSKSMYFAIQALVIYFRKTLNQSQKYLSMVKNEKMYYFIKYHLRIYELTNGEEMNLIEFEQLFKQINCQIVKLCQQEIKMIEKFINPPLEFTTYRDLLEKRHSQKIKIMKKFNQIFKNKCYISYGEFAHVYLFFRIIVCKCLHSMKEELREMFLIPQYNMKFEKAIEQKAILLCSGLTTPSEEAGTIQITNKCFRKIFQFEDVISKGHISCLLPTDQKDVHAKLFDKSTNFKGNKLSNHHEYECYIKKNLNNDAYSFFKCYSVRTRIFYDCRENLKFFCMFEEIKRKKDAIYVLESELKKINEINMIEPEKLIVNQLDEKMILRQVTILPCSKAYQEEEEFFDNEQSENSSIKVEKSIRVANSFMETHETDLNYINMESYLEQGKIQHSKLKLTLNAGMLVILILFLVVLIFSSIFLLIREETHSMSHYFEEYLANGYNRQVEISVFLLIKRGIELGQINNEMCSANVQVDNLSQFLDENLEDILQVKLNAFSKFMTTDAKKLSKELQDLYMNKRYKYEEFKDKQIKVSYIKYLQLLKSFALEKRDELISNSTFEDESFTTTIQQFTSIKSPNQTSFYSHFRSLIDEFMLSQKNLLSVIQITQMVLILLFSIFLLVCYIKGYLGEISYYLLLQNMKERSLNERVKEMRFVCDEIENIKKKDKVELEIDESIRVEERGQVKVMKVDEFGDNLGQGNFEEYQTLRRQKIVQKSKIKRCLYSKKTIIIILLTLLGILIFWVYYKKQEDLHSIEHFEELNEVLKQNAEIRAELMNLIASEWISYQQSITYHSEQQIQNIFLQSFNSLNQRELSASLLAKFEPDITDLMIEDSICERVSSSQQQKCTQYENGKINVNSLQIVPIMMKTSLNTKLLLEDGVSDEEKRVIEDGICENLMLFCNFTSKIMVQNSDQFVEFHKDLYNRNFDYQQTVIYIILSFIVLICCYLFIDLYLSINKISYEVLKFDHPKKLYSHEEFRPHLNGLIHRHKSD